MSRGFVKEEDQEEAPFIPPRAALPPGVINYVTPTGFEQLQREKEKLENERRELNISSDQERRHTQAIIDGKLNLLNERISSARILKPEDQPQDEVRFGAHIELKDQKSGKFQQFQIVGVDEADVKQSKIAFLAPLSRAVVGKTIGQKVLFKMGNEEKELEILKINYR